MVPKKKTETRETAERVPLPIGLIVPPMGRQNSSDYAVNFRSHNDQVRDVERAIKDGVRFDDSPDAAEVRQRSYHELAWWKQEQQRRASQRKQQRRSDPPADKKR
jgi:hypothetical protein